MQVHVISDEFELLSSLISIQQIFALPFCVSKCKKRQKHNYLKLYSNETLEVHNNTKRLKSLKWYNMTSQGVANSEKWNYSPVHLPIYSHTKRTLWPIVRNKSGRLLSPVA